MNMKPTVGRRIWYFPCGLDKAGIALDPRGRNLPMQVNGDEPLDAGIIAVWPDGTVNLAIFDIIGNQHARAKVFIADEAIAKNVGLVGSGLASWMPYQVSQAKAQEIGAAGPVTDDAPAPLPLVPGLIALSTVPSHKLQSVLATGNEKHAVEIGGSRFIYNREEISAELKRRGAL